MKYNITISKEQLLSTLYDDNGYEIAAGVPAIDEYEDLTEISQDDPQGQAVATLPPSLHAALEKEAARAGVTLDQQVASALASQLAELATTPHSAAVPIIRAFLEVRDGYSTDFVVADPDLNRKFLNRVRQLGGTGTDFELNWTLFDARKSGLISVPTKTRKYTVAGKDEFEFATEMAICHIRQKLERETGKSISLDKMFCDPELIKQFDAIAALLAPGYSPVEYRWVVMGLRKKAGRLWKKAAGISCPQFERLGRAIDIRTTNITNEQGLYTIRTDDVALYVGETDNLRHRVEQHFESAQGKSLLPDWLSDVPRNQLQLGVLPLGVNTLSGYRRTLELGCIGEYRPRLNCTGRQS